MISIDTKGCLEVIEFRGIESVKSCQMLGCFWLLVGQSIEVYLLVLQVKFHLALGGVKKMKLLPSPVLRRY
jgi:hypothetical protein